MYTQVHLVTLSWQNKKRLSVILEQEWKMEWRINRVLVSIVKWIVVSISTTFAYFRSPIFHSLLSIRCSLFSFLLHPIMFDNSSGYTETSQKDVKTWGSFNCIKNSCMWPSFRKLAVTNGTAHPCENRVGCTEIFVNFLFGIAIPFDLPGSFD